MGTIQVALGCLAMGIVQIILLVKIWKMTSDVSSVNKKVRTDFTALQQANIQFLLGNADLAEKLLTESFVQSVMSYYKGLKDSEQHIDALEKKYAEYFGKIGRPVPDFTKYRGAEKYFSVK